MEKQYDIFGIVFKNTNPDSLKIKKMTNDKCHITFEDNTGMWQRYVFKDQIKVSIDKFIEEFNNQLENR